MDLNDLFKQLLAGPEPRDKDLTLAQAIDLARDPQAEPRTLVDVLEHFDCDEVAEALAVNPATNRYLLGILNVFLPELVAQNPNFAELSADDSWQRNQQYYARSRPEGRARSDRLGVDPERPQHYRVRYYLEHGKAPDFQYLASLEPIPNEAFRPYLKSRKTPLRKAIAERPFLDPADFEQLARDKAKTIRLAVAKNPSASEGALRLLATDKDAAVREAASAHASCPAEIAHEARMAATAAAAVQKPAETLSPEEIAAQLLDPATSSAQLDALAAAGDAHVRYGCGLHGNASSALLESLAREDELWLREAAAYNPATPAALLEALAVEPPHDLQRALAANPATPESIQTWLAEYGSPPVRYTLANTSEHPVVLERLCEPGMDGKREDWQQHLKQVLDPKTRAGTLSNLQRKHASRHGFVARFSARHPNCPPRLYEQYGYYCYGDLARNPKFALKILEDPEAIPRRPAKAWVISEWYAQGAIPGHVADYYLASDDKVEVRRGAGSPRASIRLLQPLVFHPDPRVRNELATRKDLTHFMFEALAHDQNKKTRELIAANGRCPRELLATLAEDRVGAVRAAALANKRYVKATPGKATPGKPTRGRATKKPAVSAKAAPATLRNRGAKKDRIKMAQEARRAEVLADLAQDKLAEVRIEVARNDRTRPSLLESLLDDSAPEVRRVAVRHDLPRERLDALVDDPDDGVRCRAYPVLHYVLRDDSQAQERLLERAASDDNASARAFAAQLVAHPEVQAKLLRDEDRTVRRSLARNQSLATALAVELMASDDRRILREVAYHVQDADALCRALADPDQNVQIAAALNPLVLEDPLRFAEAGGSVARMVIAERIKRPSDALFDRLVSDPDSKVQEALAGNRPKRDRVRRIVAVGAPAAIWVLAQKKLLKPEDYEVLVAHDDPEVRYVAASEAPLDEPTFEALLADRSRLVREGLAGNDKLSADQRRRAREALS